MSPLEIVAIRSRVRVVDDEPAIRFNPPPDYCTIKPEGRAFERLKGAVEADNPGLTVRLVFVRCDVFSGPSRHVDQFGFAGTLKDNTVGRAGDLEREKWLRTREI